MHWSLADTLDIMVSLAIAVASMMIITSVGNHAGKRLRDKFVAMGQLVGRPYSGFLEQVGKPTAEHRVTTSNGDRVTVRQWQRMNFFLVLVFDDNDICRSISRDSSKIE